MTNFAKKLSDEEIFVQWINQEKQWDMLGPVQRIRHNRLENEGLKRGVLFAENNIVYPNPTHFSDEEE